MALGCWLDKMVIIRVLKRSSFRVNTWVKEVSHDGNTLLINTLTGHYGQLEGLGNDIWSKIQTPVTYVRLREALEDEYQISRRQLTYDLEAFLYQLYQEQMLVIPAAPKRHRLVKFFLLFCRNG